LVGDVDGGIFFGMYGLWRVVVWFCGRVLVLVAVVVRFGIDYYSGSDSLVTSAELASDR
jgi:hypothetical protein